MNLFPRQFGFIFTKFSSGECLLYLKFSSGECLLYLKLLMESCNSQIEASGHSEALKQNTQIITYDGI